VDITVPATTAKPVLAVASFDVTTDDSDYGFGWVLDSYAGFRTAGLGPQVTDGSVHQQWEAHWSKGTTEQYDVTASNAVKQLATGYTKHYKASELATVKVGMGAAASGKKGVISAFGWLPDSTGAFTIAVPQRTPGTHTLHLSALGGAKWELDFAQQSGFDKDGNEIDDAIYTLGAARAYTAGKTYSRTVNTAVFGPHLNAEYGLYRDGNEIYGMLPLVADSAGNAGSSDFTSVSTSLYRGSTKVGTNDDPLFGLKTFKVGSGDAAYKLTTTVQRSAKVAQASTRISASWTFHSKKPTANQAVKLPASTVRFKAATGLDSRVTAGRTVTFPVTVEGAAAGSNLKSLAVYVSYDGGKVWKKITVKQGKITVKNPARGKSISFRADITDKKGNKSSVSIYNAYYGK
jgi:hypothetical protein